MNARPVLPVAVATVLLMGAVAISGAEAAKKGKNFLHAEYESFGVRTIGLLPWLERKQDVDAERIMRLELAQGLEPTGYSFTNAVALRTMSRSVGAESLFVECMNQFRTKGEIRAETVRELGGRLSVDAILAPFLDRWEQEEIPVTVRGNSRTEIGARLALYSTKTGELLWNQYVEAKGDGPYNDPGTGQTIGSNPLQSRAGSTSNLAPPSFEEIADKWSKRLSEEFPPPPKANKAKVKAEDESAAEPQAKPSDS